jgi:hypothetical protein
LWKCMREGLDEVLDLGRTPQSPAKATRPRSRPGNQHGNAHADR